MRTTAAAAVLLAVTASAVLAAAPVRQAPLRPARDGATVGRAQFDQAWITAVTDVGEKEATLKVVTVNGTFEVRIVEDTQVLRLAGGAVSLDELAPGLPVDVQGAFTDDAAVKAASVTVGTLQPTTPAEALTLRGRIMATFGPSQVTSQRRLLAMDSDRGEAVVEVGADTDIVTDADKHLGFADLRAGQSVRVWARGSTLATVLAVQITVNQKGNPPQVPIDGLLVARGDLPSRAQRWLVGDYLIRVPANLLTDQAVGGIGPGTQVSVTAQRSPDDGEFQALRIRPVAKIARPQIVELRGRVEKLDATTLVVDGTVMTLKADLAMPADVVVGAFVKVKAQLDSDGRMEAQSIEVLMAGRVLVQFEGAIDAMISDKEWKVAGITVLLTPATVLAGDPPGVASHAEVSGAQDGGGAVHAQRIVVRSSLTPTWAPVLEGTLLDAPRRPALWTVVDKNNVIAAVKVTELTIVQENGGAARRGAVVQVYGAPNADNQLEARRIRVLK